MWVVADDSLAFAAESAGVERGKVGGTWRSALLGSTAEPEFDAKVDLKCPKEVPSMARASC
jgi:hypothetical protein